MPMQPRRSRRMPSSMKIPMLNSSGALPLLRSSLLTWLIHDNHSELKEELERKNKHSHTVQGSLTLSYISSSKQSAHERTFRRIFLWSEHSSRKADRHLHNQRRWDPKSHQARTSRPVRGVRKAHGKSEPDMGGKAAKDAGDPYRKGKGFGGAWYQHWYERE